MFRPNYTLCFDIIQKFKNNGLLAHESEVNKLQDEGDRLVEFVKHPGSAAITVRLSVTSATENKLSTHLNTLGWFGMFHFLKPGPQKCSAN